MIRKLLPLLFLSCMAFSQNVTVSTSAYTPEQLLTDIVINSDCGSVSNVVAVGSCGIGYFNANGSNFPFAEGMVLRCGNAASTAGPFNDDATSTTCSGTTDAQLHAVSVANGQPGSINDATSLSFDFIPQKNILNFNFIFASNEYGTFQCTFGDVFAFLLTDQVTGVTTNLAVIPGTSIPVSVTSIHSSSANGNCGSANPSYFGQYNVGNPNAAIDMRGQTIPMSAFSAVVPGHTYTLKLVIGDYQDSSFDSAVFIEGSSFAVSHQCDDNLLLTAFLDTNGNTVKDDGEPIFSHGKFAYQVNGSGPVSEVYSPVGSARIYPDNSTDTFNLEYHIDATYAPYYATATSYTGITLSAGSGTNEFFFPIANTGTYNDVSVSLIPTSQPRPGQIYSNRIAYSNNGLAAASGTLAFECDHPWLTIGNISQAGAVNTLDPDDLTVIGFSYDFTDLQPGETRYIDLEMNVLPLPNVTIGQVLTNWANVTNVANDIDPENNSSTLAQEVTNSFDPNDKSESHGGQIGVSQFGPGDYLDYTIRFQNIGTAPAFKVRIEDPLDPKLDEASLIMVDASHNYTMERTASQLTWKFDDILLLGQQQNEAQSKGYVHFRIKPKAGYTVGDIIENTAEIYFDGNPGIATNTVETEFVNLLGNPQFDTENVRIYPNPADTALQVHTDQALQNIRITDMLGNIVLQKNAVGNEATLDVSAFGAGMYVIEVTTAGYRKIIRKLMID